MSRRESRVTYTVTPTVTTGVTFAVSHSTPSRPAPAHDFHNTLRSSHALTSVTREARFTA